MLHHHRRYEGGDELLLVGTFRFESAAGEGGHKLHNTSSAHSSMSTPFTSRREPTLPTKTVLILHNNKVHPTTGHQDPEVEKRYTSTLSLTSALDEVGGQRHAPAALPPGK